MALKCQQIIAPRGTLVGSAGRRGGECSRRARYVDEHGYRYCMQHAKEPATVLRKATGKIRANLQPMRPDGTAFEGPPIPKEMLEKIAPPPARGNEP